MNEQQENEEKPPQFPTYPTPNTGIPLADSKQSGVLAKRIMNLMPKMRAPKGIQSKLQTVHVSHKKKTHPNPVTYW